MKRHYFISDNLGDLGRVERELEAEGVLTPQIHILSNSEALLARDHLHPVTDFMKTNVVRGGLLGAVIGAIGALVVLAIALMMGWAEPVGWTPFVFLAVITLGFCTWEGGFLGFQEKNREFRRFDYALQSNQHVLFVDIEPDQEPILDRVVLRHRNLHSAGDGASAPGWVIMGQQQLKNFVRWAP